MKVAMGAYEKACDLGLMDSCNSLAVQFMKLGITTRANQLYERACDKENAGGCFNLANSYGQGRGFKKDVMLAKRLDKKACKLGMKAACNRKWKP